MVEPAVVSPAALTIARPEPGEYAAYYDRYIALVAGADILSTLDAKRRQMLLLLSGRDEGDGGFCLASQKRNAKEGCGDVYDQGRIFSYRRARHCAWGQTPEAG